MGNNPRSIRVKLDTIKPTEEVGITRKIKRFVIFFRLLAPLATRLMHATWRKAADIRRFAEPILLPLPLFCALQTLWPRSSCSTPRLLWVEDWWSLHLHLNILANRSFMRVHWTQWVASAPPLGWHSHLTMPSLTRMTFDGSASRVLWRFLADTTQAINGSWWQ